MKISCAQCSAEYLINDDVIPDKGATATCKNCNTKIFISKQLPDLELTEVDNTTKATETVKPDDSETHSAPTCNLKKCPYCAEEIKMEAIKCKHCGSMLDRSPDESEDKPFESRESSDVQVGEDNEVQTENENGIATLINLLDKLIDIESVRDQIATLRRDDNLTNSDISAYFVECLTPPEEKASVGLSLVKFIPVIGNAAHTACRIYSDINDRSSKIKNFLTCIAGIAIAYDEGISTSRDLCIPAMKAFSYAVLPAVSEEISVDREVTMSLLDNYKDLLQRISQRLLFEFGAKMAGNVLGGIPVAGSFIKREFDKQIKEKTTLLSFENLYRLMEAYESTFSGNLGSPEGSESSDDNRHVLSRLQKNLIRHWLNQLKDVKRFYVEAKCSEKMEKNIRATFHVPEDEPVFCYVDNTTFRTCSSGIVFTARRIYWKNTMLSNIRQLEYDCLPDSEISFSDRVIYKLIKIENGESCSKIQTRIEVPLEVLHKTLEKIASNLQVKAIAAETSN